MYNDAGCVLFKQFTTIIVHNAEEKFAITLQRTIIHTV